MSNLAGGGLVSVVIPTIRTQPLLPAVLDGLLLSTRRQVEVIVSHSGRTPPQLARSDIVLLREERLLPASAARNRGAEVASGDYLFFLDDDNEVAEGAVDVLAEVLDGEENVIEVGPAMYYAADRDRVYCLGVTHGRLWNTTRWALAVPTGGSRLVASEALPNAFMVRRAQFEGIGGFDEASFPMDFEESDLAFRLRRQYGGRVVCSLDTRVWHHAPLSVRSRLAPKSVQRCFYSARNRPIFIARHRGWLPWALYILAGQWAALGSKLLGIGQTDTRRLGPRWRLAIVYVRGMGVGMIQSVRELRR
ncbi:MAG: glycosyltransferase family 2 protein [Candidatus Dormibacteria bacterium]